MKFSYSAVWDDAVSLLRANSAVVLALAGVFIFLPGLLTSYLLPRPQTDDPSQALQMMIAYFNTNWHWFLLSSLVSMIGTIAILKLLVGRAGETVGTLISGALPLLPFYFLASLLSGLMIGAASMLLLVPGLYLFGRLAPMGAALVAEDRRSPIDAIRRSFEITRGNGWRVIGLVLLVAIAGIVATMVVGVVFGSIFILAAGRELGAFLAMIVDSAAGAILSTVLLVLNAAIYRALTYRRSDADVFS